MTTDALAPLQPPPPPAVPEKSTAPLALGARGIEILTVNDALRFCSLVIESGIGPAGVKTPQQAFVALEYGLELGFAPMRALTAIYVVNGRGSLMGEAALALIRRQNVCVAEPLIELRGEGDEREGVFRFQRRTMPDPVEVTFSVADAKTAGLWKKAGPWTQYPDAMLRWRAVGTGVRLYFSDVTLGLALAEEAADYPPREEPRVVHALGQVDDAPANDVGGLGGSATITRGAHSGEVLGKIEPEPEPDPEAPPASESRPDPHGAEGALVDSTQAPAAVDPTVVWNAEGVCTGCSRHSSAIETWGHGKANEDDSQPCPHAGVKP